MRFINISNYDSEPWPAAVRRTTDRRRLYGSLNARMDRLETRMDRMGADLTGIKERLSRIEGWIAGRFGEEPVTWA